MASLDRTTRVLMVVLGRSGVVALIATSEQPTFGVRVSLACVEVLLVDTGVSIRTIAFEIVRVLLTPMVSFGWTVLMEALVTVRTMSWLSFGGRSEMTSELGAMVLFGTMLIRYIAFVRLVTIGMMLLVAWIFVIALFIVMTLLVVVTGAVVTFVAVVMMGRIFGVVVIWLEVDISAMSGAREVYSVNVVIRMVMLMSSS